MNIKTEYDPKPIPNRNMDWQAWDDDTYDYDQPVGYGATEREAIEDLKERLGDLDEWKDKHPEELCPHGKVIGECSACDFDGDRAYDIARENRVFGRR